MAQLFNQGHGWETIDEIRARKLREASSEAMEPQNNTPEPQTQEDTKPDREVIITELTTLGVKFKSNTKTEVLQELLINAKKSDSSTSEQ